MFVKITRAIFSLSLSPSLHSGRSFGTLYFLLFAYSTTKIASISWNKLYVHDVSAWTFPAKVMRDHKEQGACRWITAFCNTTKNYRRVTLSLDRENDPYRCTSSPPNGSKVCAWQVVNKITASAQWFHMSNWSTSGTFSTFVCNHTRPVWPAFIRWVPPGDLVRARYS